MFTQLINRQFIQEMLLVCTKAEVVPEADVPEAAVTSVVVEALMAAIVESVVNAAVELVVSTVAASLDSSAAGIRASGVDVTYSLQVQCVPVRERLDVRVGKANISR